MTYSHSLKQTPSGPPLERRGTGFILATIGMLFLHGNVGVDTVISTQPMLPSPALLGSCISLGLAPLATPWERAVTGTFDAETAHKMLALRGPSLKVLAAALGAIVLHNVAPGMLLDCPLVL